MQVDISKFIETEDSSCPDPARVSRGSAKGSIQVLQGFSFFLTCFLLHIYICVSVRVFCLNGGFGFRVLGAATTFAGFWGSSIDGGSLLDRFGGFNVVGASRCVVFCVFLQLSCGI